MTDILDTEFQFKLLSSSEYDALEAYSFRARKNAIITNVTLQKLHVGNQVILNHQRYIIRSLLFLPGRRRFAGEIILLKACE